MKAARGREFLKNYLFELKREMKSKRDWEDEKLFLQREISKNPRGDFTLESIMYQIFGMFAEVYKSKSRFFFLLEKNRTMGVTMLKNNNVLCFTFVKYV
jgi:hypothetical protein